MDVAVDDVDDDDDAADGDDGAKAALTATWSGDRPSAVRAASIAANVAASIFEHLRRLFESREFVNDNEEWHGTGVVGGRRERGANCVDVEFGDFVEKVRRCVIC